MDELTRIENAAQQLLLLRKHPEALSEEQNAAINRLAFLLDSAQQRIEAVNKLEAASQYDLWRQSFLDGCRSEHTRTLYRDSIERLEAFCAVNNLQPTAIKRLDAERFTQSIYCKNTKDLSRERAPNAIRVTIASVSSFYGQLAVLSDGLVSNPFLKMKSKPKKADKHDKEVPTAEELQIILDNTTGVVRCAIAFMALRGFRIGALPNLVLATRNNTTTFSTFTKGEEQRGEIPQEAMAYIGDLSRKRPFEGYTEASLQRKVQQALDKLARQQLIAGRTTERVINRRKQQTTVSAYSCHSFRHYFACTFYEANKDIERLRVLLNHSAINVTQVYLQSLGF